MKGKMYRFGVAVKEAGERMSHVKIFGIRVFGWCCGCVINLGYVIKDSVRNYPIKDLEMTEEGAVVKACLEYLKFYGAFVWRNNTGSLKDKTDRPVFFGKPGSADILGVLPGGRFIAVECKSKKGKLSDKQKNFLADIEEMGGLAIVARSIDDVINSLREQA